MGKAKVDQFARFFVVPQTNHGLSGTNYATDGDGKTIEAAPIPNTYDRLPILMDWVEKNVTPPKQLIVTGEAGACHCVAIRCIGIRRRFT